MTKSQAVVKASSRPAPTDIEAEKAREASDWVRRRTKETRVAPQSRVRVEGASANVQSANSDDDGYVARVCHALGTTDADVVNLFTTQLINAVAGTKSATDTTLNAALGFVAGIAPEGELEGALAVQMYASHCASMKAAEWLQRADTLEKAGLYASMMTKAQRTFVAQVEALAKLRGGGKQVVEVKHIYVAPGGQALVGDVHNGGPGGGTIGTGGQSHVQALEHAPGAPIAPMRCTDAEREPLPRAGSEGAEALSEAWRDEPRRP